MSRARENHTCIPISIDISPSEGKQSPYPVGKDGKTKYSEKEKKEIGQSNVSPGGND